MCLIVNKMFASSEEARNYFNKPLIAKKDIKVYKILENLNKNKTTGYSPFKYMKYKKGFQYTESHFNMNIEEYYTSLYELCINQGLHAYIKKNSEGLKCHLSQFSYSSPEIIEMYIPKGSKYFLGKDGEIVSDNLIWY